ncbi:CRISPR-associated CARF protein Csx1 [Thermoplasma volcanium]|nr:CRISPR-associated CARF protein Csx1 [Thermoplasma volcanium]
MKILFAPIGDPKNYDEVKYRIDGKDYPSNASFKVIKEALNMDETIVYAGLSLCTNSNYNDYVSCSNYISNLVKDKLQLNDESVIVAPNIYGDKFTQPDGKNTLYFDFIYYNTLKILENEKPDEIYIDITHGINYMPLLATDAIRLATYTYLLGRNSIDLAIFNSEPVIKGYSGPYNIANVYSERLYVRQALLSVLMPFLSNENKNNITNKVLKGINNCNSDLIYSNANALFSGIFPFVLLSRREIEQCIKSVERKIKILDYNNFGIEFNTSHKPVYKDTMPIELSYLHSLLYIIEKIIGNMPDSSCVKISDIKDLAKRFSTSETISKLVESEIDSIEKLQNISDKPQLLAVIKHSQSSPKSICQADKRNLLAHGGFEQNVVYLWRENGEICVNYCDCIENVRNHLK